jgi:hypothetical protein
VFRIHRISSTKLCPRVDEFRMSRCGEWELFCMLPMYSAFSEDKVARKVDRGFIDGAK